MEDFEVLTLNTTELYASKINALLSRATPKDLYDVNAMIENNVITDTELLRKCLVFYNAIGGDYDIQELDYYHIKARNIYTCASTYAYFISDVLRGKNETKII